MKIQEKNNTPKLSPARPQALVVGMEALCGAGLNKTDIYANCFAGNSFINDQGLAPVDSTQWQSLAQKLDIPPSIFGSRCSPWLYYVINSALAEAAWPRQSFKDVGFIFASTTSAVDQWHLELPYQDATDKNNKKIQTLIRSQSLAEPVDKINQHFGFQGPQSLVSSSCSASLQALALGTLWIESQLVNRCIIASTEIINSLTTFGFDSLRLLSKQNCRPFDKNRKGINLGEAAAAICLESSFNGANNKKVLGKISGIGLATDAYHATSPHPEGRGSAEAIQMALKHAHLSSDAIDWIYAHGTASVGNDLAEINAFKTIFGKHGNQNLPSVVSTKSIHGHTLACSGLLESVIAFTALNKNQFLKNHYCETWDPAFGAQTALDQTQKDASQVQHILKNSLGFGGINVAAILSRT